MPTETEHLILQASHEIGISLNQAVTISTEGQTITAEFKNRRGDQTRVSVNDGEGFKTIHAALKKAWKGK